MCLYHRESNLPSCVCASLCPCPSWEWVHGPIHHKVSSHKERWYSVSFGWCWNLKLLKIYFLLLKVNISNCGLISFILPSASHFCGSQCTISTECKSYLIGFGSDNTTRKCYHSPFDASDMVLPIALPGMSVKSIDLFSVKRPQGKDGSWMP